MLVSLFALSCLAEATPLVRTITAEKVDVHSQALDQGNGKIIVILPSKGRGAHDYDQVAS